MRFTIPLALLALGACAPEPEPVDHSAELFNTMRRVDQLEARIDKVDEANKKGAQIQFEAAVARANAEQSSGNADARDAARAKLIEGMKDSEKERRLEELERRQGMR